MKNLIFLLTAIVFLGCNRQTSTSSPDTFYFKGAVNGIDINWSAENISGFRTQVMSDDGVGILSNDCANQFCKEMDLVGSIFTQPIVNNKTKARIMVAFTQATKVEDRSMIRNWLNPGIIPFGSFRSLITDPIHDGVVVDYIDENGRGWISDLRIGNQNGGHFQSIELKDASPDKHYKKIWTAKFDCKMYSSSPGNVYDSMNIIGGEICIPVFSR